MKQIVYLGILFLSPTANGRGEGWIAEDQSSDTEPPEGAVDRWLRRSTAGMFGPMRRSPRRGFNEWTPTTSESLISCRATCAARALTIRPPSGLTSARIAALPRRQSRARADADPPNVSGIVSHSEQESLRTGMALLQRTGSSFVARDVPLWPSWSGGGSVTRSTQHRSRSPL